MKLQSPDAPPPRTHSLFVICAFGSAGDVHPLVALGAALQARGHRVIVLAGALFESLALKHGLRFEPIGNAADFERLVADRDLWHPRRGLSVMAPALEEGNRLAYEAIARIAQQEQAGRAPRLIATTLAFGARVAGEKLGLPLATVHLAPSAFLSAIAPPTIPGLWLPAWLPEPLKEGAWWLIERGFLDRLLGPGVNRLRREAQLPPVTRVLGRWVHSPQLTLGLFPRWFAQPRSDWPASVRLTGFPQFDAAAQTPPSARLDQFLAAGPPPIVFTAGSAMGQSAAFFERAVAVCERLKRRGVLLTRFRDQLPVLPGSVHHEDYVPLSRLLPHAAALVHHGGIGTAAQALAAGVPQLVTPFAFDQFDNAERLRRLGVAAVGRDGASVDRLARLLTPLLDSTEVALACRAARERMPDPARVLETSCRLLEGLR